MIIAHNGFEHHISSWSQVSSGEAVMCRNHVFFEGQEICSIPGVMTSKEWNNGNPNQDLVEQLYKNLIESGEFAARQILGMNTITH